MIPAAFAPLGNHLWQSTLFAAVAGLLTLALRHNQARVRYWIWLAASYKFLVPLSWLVSIGHQFEWRSAPTIVPPAFSAVTDAVSQPVFLTPLPATTVAPHHLLTLPLTIWAVWACGFVVVTAGWAREWLRIRAIVRAASPLRLNVRAGNSLGCHSEESAAADDEESLFLSSSTPREILRPPWRAQNDNQRPLPHIPIQILSTSARLEPGVVGIVRPVLLLPEGIAARLTQAQLQAVVAHELCHVRRRDNLTAAAHMLVEALFWFHPLVWWLGARMIDERERACDEEVLQAGSGAQVYAESILKVCEFYLESPLTCVSGITGSDLKKRIERIMKEHFGVVLSARKKLLLATVGVAALVVPLAVGVLRLQAQSAAQDWQIDAGGKMAFEVASVKENRTAARASTSNVDMQPGDVFSPTGGLFRETNWYLMPLIVFAYKLNANHYQLLTAQLPKWANAERFDIEARAANSNPTKDQFRLMMQSLLADRFKLAVHYETRQLPVFALVLDKPGKLGPTLRPHSEDPPCAGAPPENAPPAAFLATIAGGFPVLCDEPIGDGKPGHIHIGGRNVTRERIGTLLGPRAQVGRPIVDQTGLNGNFDYIIEWTPQPNSSQPPSADLQPEPSGPTFLEALKDQLGLKLESRTGPVDVLVIDHIEELSAN